MKEILLSIFALMILLSIANVRVKDSMESIPIYMGQSGRRWSFKADESLKQSLDDVVKVLTEKTDIHVTRSDIVRLSLRRFFEDLKNIKDVKELKKLIEVE